MSRFPHVATDRRSSLAPPRPLAALLLLFVLVACGTPAAPTALRAPQLGEVETRPAAFVLNWTDPNDNEKAYAVYRAEQGIATAEADDYTLVGELPADSVRFVDDTVRPGASYRYRLRAIGHDGRLDVDFPRTYTAIAPLRLVRVQSTGEFGVIASFSRPLDSSALLLSNYRFEPHLAVAGVEILASGQDLRIDTGAQSARSYTLIAESLSDVDGFALAASGGTGTFEGHATPDTESPRITGALAMDATHVLVTFSEPIGAGAEATANYRIGSEEDAGANLTITAASRESSDSVLLTTLQQSEVRYRLTAVSIEDLVGNTIASPDNAVVFAGVATSGAHADSDGDGLADAVEQRGWAVRVRLSAGGDRTRFVTSDPFVTDTDGDGIDDADEYRLSLDPREPDTDADGLNDGLEVLFLQSEAAVQDTDGDGLDDGREVLTLRTNPFEADTDGDQFDDAEEVQLSSRDPRLADLPTFGIEIGDVDLRLDVRFVATTTSGETRSESKTQTSTLSTSEGSSRSTTDTETNEFFAGATVSASYEFGLTGGASVGTEISTGYTGTWESSFTEESTRETQRAFEESQTTGLDLTQEESLQRSIEDASMTVAVHLENTGNIAFTLRNVELVAFLFDQVTGEYRPIGALVPQSGNATFNMGLELTRRGPIVFEAVNVFPALVEELMRDPQAVSFKVANYDLEDEFGRNFAFTSQDVNERTAAIVIDAGGLDADLDGVADDAKRYRVATNTGRAIRDSNGDGVVDDADRRVLFDEAGRAVGVPLMEAFEQVLGLRHYDEDETPADSLDASERATSYSTVTRGGVTHLWRIGHLTSDPETRRQWDVIVNGAIDRGTGIDERILHAEGGITVAFVRDADGDTLPARFERALGSIDTRVESDGDGLNDVVEALEPWTIRTDMGIYQAYGSPGRSDSDNDGLSDMEEFRACLGPATGIDDPCAAADAFPLSPLGEGGPSAPDRSDTDGDGISDLEEIEGYQVDLRLGGTVFVRTDPRSNDHDGDGASDGLERRLGGNPTDGSDYASFIDSDGDGLVDAEEQDGWEVTFYGVSTSPYAQGAETSVTIPSATDAVDTDGDGLNDLQERDRGLDPTSADTDGDGLSDFFEVTEGYDPLDADMDDDMRSDGDEHDTVCVVGPVRGVTIDSLTDLTKADADGDGLVDGEECGDYRTDPTDSDTDDDGVADGNERRIGTDPLVADKKLRFTLRSIDVVYDCDSDGDGGDFEGEFRLELPGGDRLVLNADALDGDDHDTRDGESGVREGESWPGAVGDSPRVEEFVLYEGQGFRFYQQNLREDTGNDHEFDDNDANNKLNESYSYANATDSRTKVLDDGDKCQLDVTWSIQRITIP